MALTRRYNERWSDDDRIAFSKEAGKVSAKQSIRKAKRRAGGEKAPPWKIIAELSFDFWRFLLSSRYQATIWPQVEKACPLYPMDFEKTITHVPTEPESVSSKVA